MAAVRYRNEFYSTEGTLWKIDIYDTQHTGAVTEFTTTGQKFTLSYQGGKDRFDPIVPSELCVMALVQNAAFESFIADIIASGENRFFVKLYKDNAMYWAGAMLTDNIKKEDSYYPYEFEMSFTDGLGTLKDHLFWNTTVRPETLYTGKTSVIGMIYRAITKAGAGLNGNTILWSATDTFISTCVHWYESHQNFYADSDPLLYSRVNNEAYYVNRDSSLTAMSCYDVLYDLLSAFGARIFLSNGQYKVVQVNEGICTNSLWRNYRVTDGAYLDYSFQDNTINAADYDILTGRSYTYLPALLKVSKKYKYQASPYGANMLPRKNNYETETALLGTVSGGTGETLKINGNIIETLTGTLSTLLGGTVHTRYKMTVKITSLTGVVRYLSATETVGTAPNVLQWEYSWSATPTYIYIYVGIYAVITTQIVVGHDIAFMTSELPFTCTGTFKLEPDGWVDQNNVSYTPLNLTSTYRCDSFMVQQCYPEGIHTSGLLVVGNYYRINNYVAGDNFTNVGAASNATGIEFTATGTTPTNWANGSELLNTTIQTPGGEVEYKATSTLSGRSKIYKPDDALIGDGFNQYSIGAIETSDGSTWQLSSTWSLKKDAATKKLHQLFASEALCGQLTPLEVMSMSILSPGYAPERPMIMSDSTVWGLFGATLSGYEDAWTGEWFKMQNMAVVEEDQIFLTSGQLSEDYLWTNQSWVDSSYNDDEVNIPDGSEGLNPTSAYSSGGNTKSSGGSQTIKEDTSVTIQKGNLINYIVIKNGAVQITLKIGTTTGGAEVFYDILPASEIRSIPLHIVLSASADQTLYVSSPAWGGGEIEFYISQEKIF